MFEIKEYLLDRKTVSPQGLYIAYNAEIVDVYITGDVVRLIALVNPYTAFTDRRVFKIATADENLNASAVKYIGKYLTDLGTFFCS